MAKSLLPGVQALFYRFLWSMLWILFNTSGVRMKLPSAAWVFVVFLFFLGARLSMFQAQMELVPIPGHGFVAFAIVLSIGKQG